MIHSDRAPCSCKQGLSVASISTLLTKVPEDEKVPEHEKEARACKVWFMGIDAFSRAYINIHKAIHAIGVLGTGLRCYD